MTANSFPFLNMERSALQLGLLGMDFVPLLLLLLSVLLVMVFTLRRAAVRKLGVLPFKLRSSTLARRTTQLGSAAAPAAPPPGQSSSAASKALRRRKKRKERRAQNTSVAAVEDSGREDLEAPTPADVGVDSVVHSCSEEPAEEEPAEEDGFRGPRAWLEAAADVKRAEVIVNCEQPSEAWNAGMGRVLAEERELAEADTYGRALLLAHRALRLRIAAGPPGLERHQEISLDEVRLPVAARVLAA